MKILFDFAIFITMFSSTIATPCDKPARSTTTGETEGEYCASDHGICALGEKPNENIMTNGQIRYGDVESNRFSNWRNITSEDGFICSLDGFGMDPYRNKRKACQWREGPSDFEKEADKNLKKCGTEGISCSCPGGQQARYGYNGDLDLDSEGERWTNWIDIKDTFDCDWGTFGGFDPARSRHKKCQCRPIPTPPTIIKIVKEYQGRWIEIAINLKQFSYKAMVTVEEGVSKTVEEVFAKDYSVSATVTVGYDPPDATGGVSGSVSVTTAMSRSYEKSTSYTMNSVDSKTNEVLCDPEVCHGVLYQWEVRAFDQFSKVAATVRTCKFVCVPFKKSVGSKLFPSCPETACNFLENCTCCAVEWSDDKDVDQKLCDDTVCSYNDGPNADNNGYTCDNWYGSLEEAKSRCTAESTCSYLHDWNGDGTNWRTCSAITVPGDGRAATKTKTCHNRRHLQDKGTAESAFDVSVDTATLSNIKLVGDTSRRRRRRRLGGTKNAILLA